MSLNQIVIGPVGRAMLRQDWPFVAGWLTARFGVEVSGEWVFGNLPERRLVSLARDYSDGSWAAWFKRRLSDGGLFSIAGSGSVSGRITVEMHVGFLSVNETDEHLTRLRRPDSTHLPSGPDTPGIERREAPLGPIDRTAANVMTAFNRPEGRA